MIDTEKLQNRPSAPNSEAEAPAVHVPTTPTELSLADLRALPLQARLGLFEQVKASLPATSLAEMNLEQECVLLFLSSKQLMQDVLVEEDIAANQKAQVANTCAANLRELVKMQMSLYTSERMKAIELSLTRVLKSLPEEAQMKFFDEYERTYAMMVPNAGQPTQSEE